VLDRLGEVAQARLDAGEGTRHDVTSLQSERLQLSVESAQRRQELRLARIALSRRIGEPSGAATWQLEPWAGPAALPTEEAAWIEAALRVRPEILAIEWELRARGEDAALASWSAWDGASVGADAERDGDWSVGPALSTPLPIFGGSSARKERASALESEAGHRLTEARRTVVEEVRSSLATLSGSQANLDRVTGELIPLQDRRRSEVEQAFRLGQVDITAVLIAEQALQQAQGLRVELEREVSTAHVRLERAVGGHAAFALLISDNARSPQP
ncbi:MAG: TolC family protein, partial [Cytophagaceae bacterium]|nr:TolC family protein [Gemmatimonadaceae bacterium]